MGAVQFLRTLAPLALVAGLVTACGHSSSSGAPAGDASSALQLRPVAARYAQDTSEGQEQLGPQTPKELVDTMKGYDCSSQPALVQGKLMECDAASDVFLLDAPLVTGGVASATALKIGSSQQWYVKVVFDKAAAATLSQAVDNSLGSELAVVLDGKVLTAVVVDPGLKDGHLGITGDLDQKQASTLADQVNGA